MTTNHRSEADRLLGWAEEPVEWDQDDRTDALLACIRHALVGIGHALLAGPVNVCQGCGIERPREHDDWCEFGKKPVVTHQFPVGISDLR